MSPAARAKLDGAKLREQLEPVVAALGYDLEELSAQRAGSRRLLRLVVDRDGGITLDDVAEVSRAVSGALDEDGVMGEAAYDLEVTSPGVDDARSRTDALLAQHDAPSIGTDVPLDVMGSLPPCT